MAARTNEAFVHKKRARAISPGLVGKRVTKIGSRQSQTVSHRCVLKYVKYQEYVSTADYGTMPSSWLDTSRESGWNRKAAAYNDTGRLVRLRHTLTKKRKEKGRGSNRVPS